MRSKNENCVSKKEKDGKQMEAFFSSEKDPSNFI